MKPHASIFQSTFAQLQGDERDVNTSQFLHVEDHPTRDYKAVKAIGAHARLVWRSTQKNPPVDVQEADVVPTLLQLE
ncbi:hypothetical protein P3T76_013219 [Phytophthora citrophthora]|uniref:Uncharacterized protein n=1 Tax=Phytophthora citrophthora TaxID=4793 RepID=A0AAD9LCD8_9STRA|nr:hypothetical protein P3T76_013219 [Phytophthora citrophthora]